MSSGQLLIILCVAAVTLVAVAVLRQAGIPAPVVLVVAGLAIIYLGFAVIMATLVGQGMSLPWIVHRLRLPESPSVAEAERRARIELAQVALDRIGSACESGELPEELADGLRAQYIGRLRTLQTAPNDGGLESDVEATAESEMAVRRDLIALQRQSLLNLRDRGRIGVTTLRTIGHDLDLEETRLSSA